jgi:uncharacterized protein DUF6491
MEAKMSKRAFVFSLAALVLTATPALTADEGQPPAKPSSCAFVRSIDYWKPIDDENAYIYTSPRKKFKVKFVGPCRELKWAIFARLDTRPSAGLCLSVGDTLVFGRGSPFPSHRFEFEERCTISAIEPVAADEKEAMPAKPPEAPPQ